MCKVYIQLIYGSKILLVYIIFVVCQPIVNESITSITITENIRIFSGNRVCKYSNGVF